MYNFLIVDDEEFICDSMYEIFSSQQDLELEIFQAYSAVEALELLNQHRFDIVMTDIEMPGMSGLELMKEISLRWMNCKMIFLTAHSKFDYIYSSMQVANTRYLLKTERIEKIVDTVRATIRELEQDHYSTSLIDRTTESYVDKEWYCRYLVTELVNGNFTVGTETRSELFDARFPIDLRKPVHLFIGAIGKANAHAAKSEMIKIYDSVVKEVENGLSASCKCIGAFLESEYLVWLAQPLDFSRYIGSGETDKLCFSLIHGNLPIIQNIIAQSLNVPISFVVSREPTGWESVGETFNGLKRHLFYQHNVHNGEILLYTPDIGPILQASPTADTCETGSQAETAIRLEKLIRESEQEEIEQFFQDLADFPPPHGQGPYYYYEKFAAVSTELISIMNKYNFTSLVDQKLQIEKLVSFNAHLTWQAAVQYLRQATFEVLALREHGFENAVMKMIDTVNQYINDNLDKELSLIKLSAMMHYNPSYFSRVYKDVTGMNVKKYISNARINKAKQLLAETNLKIADISEMVGFDLSANFARFFKDITGLTPQKYRDTVL